MLSLISESLAARFDDVVFARALLIFEIFHPEAV